jgi:hypothetical protein
MKPDQFALTFENVPKCPLLQPPGRQNSRRCLFSRIIGRMFRRRCQRSPLPEQWEPGTLIGYKQSSINSTNPFTAYPL